MAMPTPGRLTALWTILRTLGKLGGRVSVNEALSFASRSALRYGGLPIQDGYRLALRGGFVREIEDEIEPSDLGEEALHLCNEDEPDALVRRLFVSVLILRDPPPWVALWQGDSNSLDLVLSPGDRQVLTAADLYPPQKTDDNLLRKGWWSALAVVPLPEEVLAQRKLIGNSGEELSYEFERHRLTEEGFPRLAEQVRWVGRESPAYGFAIASFSGRSGL